MANDRIIGHSKEKEIRAFIYKCLIFDKMSKLRIVSALTDEFGIVIGASTVLNYYQDKMFWRDINPLISELREGLIKGIESSNDFDCAEFSQKEYDKVIKYYNDKDKPPYMVDLVAEAAALLRGNIEAAKEGKGVLKTDLTVNYLKLHKALQDAK